MAESPILCVVGARPNFMKMAAVLPPLKKGDNALPVRLIHTGQHYDAAMKDAFFKQLSIPEPDRDLGVGSGSHAEQTAEVMIRFEKEVDHYQARAVLVVGDVNSTIACALVAAKKGIPVIHVEAGLRSFDRNMPEEINRILTDQLSDYLFTTEKLAEENLLREGISQDKIHFVGNVMIDTLKRLAPQAPEPSQAIERVSPGFNRFTIEKQNFALVTLHRPSNVDNPEVLQRLIDCLQTISQRLPLIFPLHPRTKKRLEENNLLKALTAKNILLLPPIGYLEMLGMMAHAKLVLTDSGGIQEETTALGVPCITLRENTERPITITQGTNTIVGVDKERILKVTNQTIDHGGKAGREPELWDGFASERIAKILKKQLA
ncbi:non-hydrolyzing UDP-N-acetylglucosamine 2-epimerase [Magnetococcales bacterium HHB-1]